ncbi:hypothetical protein Ddye_000479 [Dipteronia dyeriana]|uniref:Reverse transcriptase zinc-binding domain-containing protein n=1 Tax=Dipteronia dyeriana TaxID=168575 RepID=A0AAD9XM12_9ROSI|nr:hypothetical protein Ddye_000479 [Dipteronia dyeriana]
MDSLEGARLAALFGVRIFSPPILGLDTSVSALITLSGGWNVHLIRDLFFQEDDESILSFPLGSSQPTDSLLWHYKKSGNYSVRSGYRVGCDMVQPTSLSGLSGMESWWKALRRFQIPGKVKKFMWKACNNWIPTFLNLAKLGISNDSKCQCGEQNLNQPPMLYRTPPEFKD